jgi:hypothetical protein
MSPLLVAEGPKEAIVVREGWQKKRLVTLLVPPVPPPVPDRLEPPADWEAREGMLRTTDSFTFMMGTTLPIGVSSSWVMRRERVMTITRLRSPQKPNVSIEEDSFCTSVECPTSSAKVSEPFSDPKKKEGFIWE